MDNPMSNVAQLPGSGTDGEHYRDPPVNYEAEQALLGAILANNTALDKVTDFLRAEHFVEPVHGRIFEASRKPIDRGQIADWVQAMQHLSNLVATTRSRARSEG